MPRRHAGRASISVWFLSYAKQRVPLSSDCHLSSRGKHPGSFHHSGRRPGKKVERDIDGDGTIDQIAHVDKRGNPIRHTIDSNADGKPDLWEKYDEAEALVKRSWDYKYDGTPGFTENAG
jgi:hypothetical protein